jgi:hypothetical protein
MSIAISVQVINGTSGPVNGLADDPEITIRRGDTFAIVAGPANMSDVGAGGFYRFLFTPTVPGLDYLADIDADPNVTGQVPNGNRYYAVSFDDQQDELYRDRGLDPVNVKTTTENTAKTDYTEAVAGGGAPITKQSVKAGNVTTTTRT